MASAEAFARQILFRAGQTEDEPTPITQMQLHKLLYYVQGWSLAAFGEPAFDSRVEAWQHGPVVPDVYPLFRVAGKRPLEPVSEPADELGGQHQALVDWVMDEYGRYSAAYLRHMTHNERPWKAARGALRDDEPSTTEITLRAMQAFFCDQQDKQLKRHGLTLQRLRDLHERAKTSDSVPFDEFVGRLARGD